MRTRPKRRILFKNENCLKQLWKLPNKTSWELPKIYHVVKSAALQEKSLLLSRSIMEIVLGKIV